MLNKEIKDAGTLFLGSIIIVLFTAGFSFSIVRLLVDSTFPFSEFAPLLIYVSMMGVSFYLGISLFSEEKSQKSFEYLFSLPYSRTKILSYKIFPRLIALLLVISIYALMSVFIRLFPAPSGWAITFLLYFSLFLVSASMSLLHRNHITNLVYALGICMIIYGMYTFFIIQFRGLGSDFIFSIIRILLIITLLISLFLFLAFWRHFRKADLSNHTRIFWKCITGSLKFIGLPLLTLLAIWILINRFDTSEPEIKFESPQKIAGHIDNKNGFYRLWTLSEDPRHDVESDRMLMKYRHIFDPEFNNGKYLKTWDHQAYRDGYMKFHRLRMAILQDTAIWLDWNTHPRNNLAMEIFKSRNRIMRLRDKFTVFQDRYRQLLESNAFEDMTQPRHDSPLPNLVAWLHISKLYDWLSVLDALEGNWERGTGRLLDHIDFSKLVLKGSRVLIINLTGKNTMQYSLICLAGLMNQKQCPAQIYEMILERIQPVSAEEVGSRTVMQADYLSMADFVDRNLFLIGVNPIIKTAAVLFFQKNRTKKYFFEPYQDIMGLDSLPPFQWKTGLDDLSQKYSRASRGLLRWVINPYGKFLAEHMAIPNLLSVVHRSNLIRTLVDMIRISAELHLKYDPEKEFEEILKTLNSYKALDPCSGESYRWNPEKQVLYSLGVDRDDDGGEYHYHTFLNTDYILPVILHRQRTPSENRW